MKKIYLFLTMVLAVTALQSQVQLVKDIRTGTGNSNPGYYGMLVANGKIYFTAYDGGEAGGGVYGNELWKSDGTAAGTVLIKDIVPGTESSTPTFYFTYNNVVYFSASSDDNGYHPWKTDGTESGTVQVNDGPAIFTPTELDGVLYYRHNAEFSNNSKQLYTFDGTTSAPVPNVGTAIPAGGEMIYDMVAFDRKIFMYMREVADEPKTIGIELYMYDPATDLFSLVKDIDPGSGDASISNFTVLGDKLYFEAENYLWETDGTAAGTKQVDLNGAATPDLNIKWVNSLYAWEGKLFFEGDDQGDDLTSGDQLLMYDPVAETLTDLSKIVDGDHDPMYFTPMGGYLYYRGEPEGTTTGYLFRTDGSMIEQVDNTITITTLNFSSYPWAGMVVLNDVLYFDGTDDTHGKELFMYDPLASAINKVSDGDNTFTVAPNPSNGVVTIDGFQSVGAMYQIFNLAGKSVEKGIVTGNQIQYNVSAGVYLLQIIDGSKTMVSKIIVK